MLQLSAMLLNRPVLSLRTGGAVATIQRPIINPYNFKIEGFYCTETRGRQVLILLTQDVRDVLPQGIAVDDADVLTEPQELIRLKDILQLNFELIGKAVYTASKDKLGKVSDYATDVDSMIIQKIYVSQSVFKSLGGGNLGIDRGQIIEVTNERIIVNDLTQKIPARAGAMA